MTRPVQQPASAATRRPKVVITLPAYKAEGTLTKTVSEIPAGLADEIILVDDASPDGTVSLARSLGLTVHVHSENRGYGGNQKTCYTEALRDGADIVVLLHPDYQYEPKAVPLLIAPILAGDADMTFGSRFAGLGDPLGGGMPLYRYIGNRITTVLENVMLGSRFTDMHSGLRAYTRECLLSLPFLGYTDDFAFDSQMLVDAVTLGHRVVEVPIPTRYTKESSSVGIGRSVKYIVESLAYCARKTALRGRRGRRTPVVTQRPEPVPGRVARMGGVRSAGAGQVLPTLLEQVRGYALSGDSLLLLGADGWRPAGDWTPAEDLADVAVLAHHVADGGDPEAALALARHRLRDEGLLALSSSLPSPRVAQLVRAAGFRLVEWVPLSDGEGEPLLSIALARPRATAGI